MTDKSLEIFPLCCSKYVNENPKTVLSSCKICEAPARYLYFGVLSCQSCKTFFKRNAKFGQTSFSCDSDGHCQININNRHVCRSCRLAKCFRSGMSTELFRSPHSKRRNKESLLTSTNLMKIVNQSQQIQLLPTLNLLRSDISKLTNDQWTLLSNLVNNYDDQKITSVCQRLIEEDKFNLRMRESDETLVQQFFKILYETTDLCLRSNGDIRNLPSNNRSILLRSGADSVACYGGAFSMYKFQLTNCRSFLNALNRIYGSHSLALTLNSIKWIDPDIVHDKLSLLLLLFSKTTCIFSSIMPFDHIDATIILEIQNKYADVTWKYLLYKYDYRQAVQRFMNSIQCILAVIQTMAHVQSVQSHVNDIETLAENTELTLILDDIDQIIDH